MVNKNEAFSDIKYITLTAFHYVLQIFRLIQTSKNHYVLIYMYCIWKYQLVKLILSKCKPNN